MFYLFNKNVLDLLFIRLYYIYENCKGLIAIDMNDIS